MKFNFNNKPNNQDQSKPNPQKVLGKDNMNKLFRNNEGVSRILKEVQEENRKQNPKQK